MTILVLPLLKFSQDPGGSLGTFIKLTGQSFSPKLKDPSSLYDSIQGICKDPQDSRHSVLPKGPN